LGLALLGACFALAGCSASSKSNSPSTGGTAGEAGRGGGGGISGASGSSDSAGKSSGGGAGSGGTIGGDAGSSGTTGGTAGDPGTAGGNASGTGGSVPSSGGTAGDTAGDAGESAGGIGGTAGTSGTAGTGGACQDLCTGNSPACCSEPLLCVESIPTCRIEFLVDKVDTTYEYADLEAKIATLTGGIDVTILSTDIEWAAADAPPSARFEFRLSAEASLTHAKLKGMFLSRPFLVSCGDQALFVGVTYMFEGAAALRTPVIHIEETETGAIRLLLGAWQSAWAFSSASPGTEEFRERIDRPELRAAFCGRGIMNELEAP